MIFLEKFFWLILAHFVGDYVFQSDYIAKNKGNDWYVMLVHSFLWAGCVCLGLQYLGLYSFWKIPFLIIGHAPMDFLKTKLPTKKWMIYPDQCYHILQLFIVYFGG